MNKRNLIISSAVAAALGLISAHANAAGTAAFAEISYATEGIPSTGAVTIPAGIIYTGSNAATGAGLVTFTLPTGVTFTSTPSITTASNYTAASVAGGGAGSNTLTVNVTGGAAGTGSITLGAFTVTGATTLAGVTGAGAFQYSVQASGWTAAADNDATALRDDLARSARQNILTTTTAGSAASQIDVASPSNGTRFTDGATPNQAFHLVGVLTPTTGANMNATNTATFSFASGTTTSVTVSGYPFSSVSSVYMAPAGTTSCAATAPTGSTTGTVSGNSVTFTGVVAGAGSRAVCLINSGSNILPALAGTITATATRDTFTSPATAAVSTAGQLTYNGTVVNVNYVVGNGAGYAMYLNVVNPASAAAPVYISLRKSDGTVMNGTLASSLGANSSQLFTVADINTATGANLANESSRAFITLLSTAPIRATNFMLNPGNAVTQIGQTF